jgi:hypothetical protein
VDRFPWDDRRTTKAQDRALAQIMPPTQSADYRANRNDYAGEGRNVVDAALSAGVTELAEQVQETALTHLWRGRVPLGRWMRNDASTNAANAAAALRALADELEGEAKRARNLAAVLDLRAEDGTADEALHIFSDAAKAAARDPQS